MKKNKFNIGQKVIVVEGREIVEKIVAIIDGSGKVNAYTLTPPSAKSDHLSDSLRAAFDISNPFKTHTSWFPEVLVERYPLPTPSKETYREDEIFEDESDFRTNVKIHKPEPTKKELKEQLNIVAETLATTGNTAVRDLIQKINS